MQLKININFTNTTETLLFNLIDNAGVRAWADHCREIPSARTIAVQLLPPRYHRYEISQELWKQQQLVQQELAKTILPIPLPVNAVDQITQHHLNVWHRWFTEHSQRLATTDNNLEPTNELRWLHELNQIVHALESGISGWPVIELQQNGREFNLQPNMDAHGFGFGYVDLTPHRQYHSWEHADLILDQAVHGKTTMQSFIDNDDPKHWDTTGHHSSWGGCKLVYGTYRQEIYQSPLFRKWMDQNAVTHQDLWGDYPLGNIVNRDEAQLNRIFQPQQVPVSSELIILD
jgi:hypothetical protein